MNAEEICRLLVSGSVDAADVPDMGDEDVREEVRRRLAGVGCALAYSPATGRWVARLDGPLPAAESHQAVLSLHAAEQAVLAACWLHLRLLPAERARVTTAADDQLIPDEEGEPSMAVEDLLAQFHGKLRKTYLENIVLGHLKNAGFLRQHGGRLFAGPLLDTIDDVVAGERARVLLARHQRLSYLKRRAEEIEREENGTPADSEDPDLASGAPEP